MHARWHGVEGVGKYCGNGIAAISDWIADKVDTDGPLGTYPFLRVASLGF